MTLTHTATQETTADADPAAEVVETGQAQGRVGHIVVGSLIGGLLVAVFVVTAALAGGIENVITHSVPLAFAPAWVMLAMLAHDDSAAAFTKSARSGKAA